MCQQQETLPAGVTAAPFACRRGALTLRGVEYRPAGTALPIAIVCHGFMQNLDTVRHYARALAGAGWLAYCFDFSGGCAEGCRSDGATTDMSALTEVEDLQAVLAWAASRPYADSGRVLLMGCSMGGFVSALTAAKLGARVQKLVLFYPALCIPDDARAGQMMSARFDPHEIPEFFDCGPMRLSRRYAADVAGIDPFAAIAPYPGDVLLVHGDADDVVSAAYSRRAAAAYRAAAPARTVALHILPGAGHGFMGRDDETARSLLLGFAAAPASASGL